MCGAHRKTSARQAMPRWIKHQRDFFCGKTKKRQHCQDEARSAHTRTWSQTPCPNAPTCQATCESCRRPSTARRTECDQSAAASARPENENKENACAQNIQESHCCIRNHKIFAQKAVANVLIYDRTFSLHAPDCSTPTWRDHPRSQNPTAGLGRALPWAAWHQPPACPRTRLPRPQHQPHRPQQQRHQRQGPTQQQQRKQQQQPAPRQ
jgi:hypothetical protein